MLKYILLLSLGLGACTNLSRKSETPLKQVTLSPHYPRKQYENTSAKFMVSTQGKATTAAAIEVIKKGGNLYDAFTAISFAIGVERPQSTGIGGGGFVVFYHAKEKKVYALDFRETAPRKAHSDMYKDDPKLSITGALSVATPGLVAGVLEVHKKYGKLSLFEVLQPAIRMAEKGVPVYPELNIALKEEHEVLAQFPSTRKIFLDPKGEPWPVGHLLKQPDMAKTLRLIAAQGADAFYKGSIANKISASIIKNNGILDKIDLQNYKTKWRDPVQAQYKNYEIYSQPPPSSGGTHVIQILNVVENLKLKSSGPQSPRTIHLTASAMQKAFHDRAQFMGDPDFSEIPVSQLISKNYAEQISSQISKRSIKPFHKLKPTKFPKEESPETTHFSLIDDEGNMIASTQTINGYFGSALVAEGTGIVLNNEMDDFASHVGASNLYGAIGGEKNLIQPLKRPLSSMSPTLVFRDGTPFMAVGTPSGTRIITCVALTLLNVLEHELPLWDAVTLNRYHQQWQPDQLFIEPQSFSPQTIKELKNAGHNVTEKDLGCRIQAVQKKATQLLGVSDPRGEGSSQGL